MILNCGTACNPADRRHGPAFATDEMDSIYKGDTLEHIMIPESQMKTTIGRRRDSREDPNVGDVTPPGVGERIEVCQKWCPVRRNVEYAARLSAALRIVISIKGLRKK